MAREAREQPRNTAASAAPPKRPASTPTSTPASAPDPAFATLYADLPGLPDIIAPGLTLLFVGFNPSVYSAQRGHYYARPSNRFWPLLALAGLTSRRYAPEEDATLPDLGIGITDLCPIPTPGIADVPRAVAEGGRGALTAKVERYAPRIVSFNGRATYERFYGRPLPAWGLQEARIGAATSLVFVTPSSSGRANGVGAAREGAFLALGALVRDLHPTPG